MRLLTYEILFQVFKWTEDRAEWVRNQCSRAKLVFSTLYFNLYLKTKGR